MTQAIFVAVLTLLYWVFCFTLGRPICTFSHEFGHYAAIRIAESLFGFERAPVTLTVTSGKRVLDCEGFTDVKYFNQKSYRMPKSAIHMIALSGMLGEILSCTIGAIAIALLAGRPVAIAVALGAGHWAIWSGYALLKFLNGSDEGSDIAMFRKTAKPKAARKGRKHDPS
jgi:hypothetical protein